jgi:Flp pilus assembly protein CpaB
MRLAALISRHRRPLAAACAAAAMAFALAALRPAVPRGVPVLTATRDLPSGATLRAADVRRTTLPAAVAPAGLVRSGVAGRVLAGPMRRGEPVTDARLVGRGLLAGYGPGLVAVPVRMADAESVRLLRPGDRIDVLATAAAAAFDTAPDEVDRPAGRARAVAWSVPVVTIPRLPSGEQSGGLESGGGPGEGALVVVAARRDQAATLAAAAHDSRWSFVIVG